jgi:hypothetical protein
MTTLVKAMRAAIRKRRDWKRLMIEAFMRLDIGKVELLSADELDREIDYILILLL